MCKFTTLLLFLTGQIDAFFLYGSSKELLLNFSSHNYKENQNYGNRKDIKTGIKAPDFFIKSPFRENLHLAVNFSTTHSSSPNIKVIFSGYDHRSWIDIFISYQEMLKDISSFDFKYLHKTIHLSNGLEANSIMNYKPNGSDQLLVFIPDNPNSHVWKTLDMTIRGNSYKIMRIHKNMQDHTLKIIFFWNTQLKIIPGLQYLMSLWGESHQLSTYFIQKCKTNETCPRLKVYWIPDQLRKYRDDILNTPHSCIKPPQLARYNLADCLNFSSQSTKEHYYVYAADYVSIIALDINSVIVADNKSKRSWNYASSLCQDMGGFLPVIRSKSELDALIAFVALSPYLLIQEKIFIGLSTKIKSKV